MPATVDAIDYKALEALKGKNIYLVVDGDSSEMTEDLISELKNAGANLAYSTDDALNGTQADRIANEIKAHTDPKIDSIVFYNPNVTNVDSQKAIKAILDDTKLPAVICDMNPEQRTFNEQLRGHKVKHFDLSGMYNATLMERVACAVGKQIVDRDKAGAEPSGV